MPKNTTQCPRPGLERGPLDPEISALTMRILGLHFGITVLVSTIVHPPIFDLFLYIYVAVFTTAV